MATPRHVESNQNALKSGLDAESQFVVGEDRDEFAALQHEYITRFHPLTPEERFQVDTLIRNEWTLRRLFRAEAHLWEYHALRADRSEGVPLGAALMAADQVFRRLQRRVTLAERSYREAFAELERLQHARAPLAAPPEGSQPQPNTVDSPELGSFLHVTEPRPEGAVLLGDAEITDNAEAVAPKGGPQALTEASTAPFRQIGRLLVHLVSVDAVARHHRPRPVPV